MKVKFMINCKEAARLLSDKLEYTLPFHKRALLRMHVAMCGACTLYGKQIKALKNLVARRQEIEKDDSPLSSESSLSNDACEHMKLLLKKKNSQ